MPNRLTSETSPYLLQHAENPVDWYPWGAEALERARRENRPILLSIGYAACHWCHVMAHESFEDDDTARLMNERFVNIKVDREERPDLDGIYMQAVQAMTGHGGWPMTVFLTPDGVPFYGGTYFPPEERHGLPSFRTVLTAIADAYRDRPGEVARTTERMKELFAATTERARSSGTLTPSVLERAYRGLAAQYDERSGGFGGAPKFPQAMALDFLLRYGRRTGTEYAVQIAHRSFVAMGRGGIYDQLGGGFHRYSVDARWLVPHFEKMLYDNALLSRLGVHLWQATDDPEVRETVERTVEWVEREMTSPEGGFYSSLDADSEGEEGKFYVWRDREIDETAGDAARAAKTFFGVTPEGNFEGHTILHVPAPPRVAAARLGLAEEVLREQVEHARTRLLAARVRRVPPGRDDKILAGWNALMLRAIAEGARAFDREEWRTLAIRNGAFLFRELVRGDRVMRSHKDGVTRITGFLEDHAGVALAALALYELTFDAAWLGRARALADSMVEWFWDDEAGVFFDTARDHEPLVTRPREVTDNATPAGTSLAVELLLRIAEVDHAVEARRRASWVLETLGEPMARHGIAFGHLLGAADLAINGAVEVALVGDPASDDFRSLAGVIGRHYIPSLVLAGGAPAGDVEVPLLAGREAVGGAATAYVCRQYACEAPVTDARALAEQLEGAGGAPRADR